MKFRMLAMAVLVGTSCLFAGKKAVITAFGGWNPEPQPGTNWYMPEGVFCQQLNETVKEMDPGMPDFMEVCQKDIPDWREYLPQNITQFKTDGLVVFPFWWEQSHKTLGLTAHEQIDGAAQMVKFIYRLMAAGYTDFEVVAHCYGAHVTEVASWLIEGKIPEFLEDGSFDPEKWEVRKSIKNLCAEKLKELAEFKAKLGFDVDEVIKKKAGIVFDRLMTMNVPEDYLTALDHVDHHFDFKANMKSIKYLHAYWSNGDFIARLGGKLRLPEEVVASGRAHDIEVFVPGTGCCHCGEPGHFEMHYGLSAENLAKWGPAIDRAFEDPATDSFKYPWQVHFKRDVSTPVLERGKEYPQHDDTGYEMASSGVPLWMCCAPSAAALGYRSLPQRPPSYAQAMKK